MNNFLAFFLVFNFQLAFICSIFAQTNPPLRIELESAKDQQDYYAVSLEQRGVAVFYQSAIVNIDTVQWVFIQYDTNLVRLNLFKINIPNLCQYVVSDFSEGKLYMFFQKPAYKKDTLKNYLLEWNVYENFFQLFELQKHKYPNIASLTVKGDHLFSVIHIQKATSVVCYNFKTDACREIQFGDDEITAVESFIVNDERKETYSCIFLKNKKGSWAELIVTDYSGNIKERSPLPSYHDIVYNTAKMVQVDKDSLLIVGGYSNSKDKKLQGCYSGIYSIRFAKSKFFDFNTYSFGPMLAKDSGLNNRYQLESNLAMNGHLRQSNNHIFFISEAFYPEYQYTTASPLRSYGYYGYEQPVQIFSGYRILYANILELDTHGVFLNENYMHVNNVLTKSFSNFVDLYRDENGNTLIFYVHNNEVVSQFLSRELVLGPQTSTTVELLYKTDQLEYASNILMQHWYGNKFLLSGYQYIKNTQRGKGRRYVFFMNKLICE